MELSYLGKDEHCVSIMYLLFHGSITLFIIPYEYKGTNCVAMA